MVRNVTIPCERVVTVCGSGFMSASDIRRTRSARLIFVEVNVVYPHSRVHDASQLNDLPSDTALRDTARAIPCRDATKSRGVVDEKQNVCKRPSARLMPESSSLKRLRV